MAALFLWWRDAQAENVPAAQPYISQFSGKKCSFDYWEMKSSHDTIPSVDYFSDTNRF